MLGVLDKFPKRDSILIEIEISHAGKVTIDSSSSEVQRSLRHLESRYRQAEEDDEIWITTKVLKNTNDRVVSIYSLENIVEFWQQDGLLSSLDCILELTERADTLRVFGVSESVHTNNLFITPFESDAALPFDDDNRDVILSKRDKVCHFSNSSIYKFLPGDFQLSGNDQLIGEYLSPLFLQLKILCSLVFICDFSKFDKLDGISLTLNGYRQISNTFFQFDDVCSEFFDIYDWIYGEGDVVDKIGLARNIISLHLIDSELLRLQGGVLHSISSGYQIYLKDNVKQYIEIKNKLSEFIQASSDKASLIARNVGGYYRNSIWGIYSFFLSVFLFRILSKNSDVLVTNSIYVIFVVFSALVVIVMNYAISEFEDEKKRFECSYNSLKERYVDLLTKEDLSRILDSDRQFLEDINYLELKKRGYQKLWGASLAVLFISISLIWLLKLSV